MLKAILKLLSTIFISADQVGVFVLVLLALRGARLRRPLRPRVMVLCLLPLVLIHWTPLGRWTAAYLEGRFAPPARFPQVPGDPTGLIFLGGSFITSDSEDRGEVVYNLAAPRLFESLALARQAPHARIVFTGTPVEAALARRVIAEQGIDLARVTFEAESANTRDNAWKTRDLIQPKPDERWILVTSALHLPRAVGLFRGAGWTVTPYPVHHVTGGSPAWRDWLGVLHATNPVLWRAAAHEIAGLVYHWLVGETPELIPQG